MSIKRFDLNIKNLLKRIYRKARVLKYKTLSTCDNVEGTPICVGPVLLEGIGKIIFKENVTIGIITSPYFYSTYCYIEARNASSIISIGSGVYINNNACLISDGEGIFIGADVLIGPNFTVFDSDFHDINPLKRMSGLHKTAKVEICDNVFIGSNVTILKGVTIGKNSVVASNSTVSSSIPTNVLAGGNPCKVLKEIVY